MTDKKYPTSSFIAQLRGDSYHAGFNSKDIVASEAKGQHDLVNSTQLPIEGDWEILKSWGVVQTENHDDLFVETILPNGWIKRQTGNSMWSELVDELGHKRASIFYKAAHYDRKAKIDPIDNRFTTQKNQPFTEGLSYDAIDLAKDTIIYTGAVGHFASKTDDPSIVGFMLDDIFYSNPVCDSYHEEFFKCSESPEGVTFLVEDEMHKQYDYVKSLHDIVKAANNKARESAESFIVDFLGNRDQWEID